MRASICRYKNGARGAFTLTLDDGCYYDTYVTVRRLFDEIFEETGILPKATVGITVDFLNERLISLFSELFELGYLDMASHSVTHCVPYNVSEPDEKQENDLILSRARLEEIFKGQRAHFFIPPGARASNESLELIKKHYVACRNGSEGLNYPGELDWYSIKTFTAMLKREPREYIEIIDKAVSEGAWCVQMNHWLTEKTEDVFHSQSLSSFEAECRHLGSLIKSGDIWLASLNEAYLYLKEWEASTLDVLDNKISINCPLSADLFDFPLTLCLNLPSNARAQIIDKDGGVLPATLIKRGADTLVDLRPSETLIIS